MNHFFSTKGLLSAAAVANLAALVLYGFFFLYIKATNESISTLLNEADLVVQKEARLRSIQGLIKDTETQRAQLNTYFVAGEDAVVGFIETIEELGVLSGAAVKINSVSATPTEPDNPKGNELLRVTFEATGTWKDIFQLFLLVESLPLKVAVTQTGFNLMSAQKSESGGATGGPLWKGVFGVTVVKLPS